MMEMSAVTLISAAKSIDIQLVEMIEFFERKNRKRGAALRCYARLSDTQLHATFEQYRLAAYELRVMYEQARQFNPALPPYKSFCEVFVSQNQAELDAAIKDAKP